MCVSLEHFNVVRGATSSIDRWTGSTVTFLGQFDWGGPRLSGQPGKMTFLWVYPYP